MAVVSVCRAEELSVDGEAEVVGSGFVGGGTNGGWWVSAAADAECGGGALDTGVVMAAEGGVAEVLDIVETSDTRLSGCERRSAYPWWMGGRGLGSRRRRGRDAVLAAGVGQEQRTSAREGACAQGGCARHPEI